MSEQSKSNLQAVVAGLLGFAAVVLVGGGALFLHSKLTAHTAAAPVPAAAPIDLGSSMPRPGSVTPAERRENSPAPIIGHEEEGVQAAPSEARAGAPASPAARAAAARAAEGARSAPALKATEHLTAEASTTAEANVAGEKDEAAKAVKVRHVRKAAAPAALAAGDGAAGGDAAVASVHYGVKSRSELMGRAAGPVYNFSGGGKKGGSTAGAGKIASGAAVDAATLADLKRQLTAANLPPEQRAAILKQLEGADGSEGGVEDAPR